MKIIETNESARFKIHSGVNQAGDIVRSTYGPAGLNVAIGSKFLKPTITNDGLRAIKAIELEDEIENLAVRIMEDGMQTTNDIAGDNRTLTGILIQEIFNAGYERFNDTFPSMIKIIVDPQAIKQEIKQACQIVVEEIKKSQLVESKEDLQKVAFVATEDKEYAEIIADVVFQVGKDGVIKVEESDGLGIDVYISEGMEINSGMLHRDMATNEKLESIVEDALILVTNCKITTYGELSGIAGELNTRKIKDLVIFAPDFDQHVIRTFNADRAREIFRVLAVKIPPWDKGLYQDICTVSGATIIEDSNITFNDLGQVSKVISNSEKTTLIGGRKDKEDAIDLLKAEIKICKSAFEKQKLEERIARISGKVALIEVGAITKIDRERVRDKIQDGVRATQGAREEGAHKGGGFALSEIAKNLPENILTKALQSPYLQILKSVNEIGDDVIDSAKSLRVAVESASNTAGNLLTIGTAIADKNESDTEQDN